MNNPSSSCQKDSCLTCTKHSTQTSSNTKRKYAKPLNNEWKTKKNVGTHEKNKKHASKKTCKNAWFFHFQKMKNFNQAKNMLHQKKHEKRKNIFWKACFLAWKSMIKNQKR